MIAVDTSALMAVVLNEPEAGVCIAALENEDTVLISAGTLAEALIVSARRNIAQELSSLIDGLGFQIISVTPASARRISQAYQQWGKGVHPAGLNFGDCFAYEVAKTHGCDLLYVGDDFAKTDIQGIV
ncbi:MAG TPA: type II toxin-antitoxin system VapC family toxin [Bryobacteraceae bacterium]|nr:type II toxin-antitoxin system VapC family toxin [Bryobacteraceae bacterium]